MINNTGFSTQFLMSNCAFDIFKSLRLTVPEIQIPDCNNRLIHVMFLLYNTVIVRRFPQKHSNCSPRPVRNDTKL